ncbi:Sin-like protein conserved region-domain-containing protein [Jimgerdemannia flammicorona]|uniref:Sin-like protein conserved region-domain-containing protein n=1 Tax=Jimgerdemannia flammicorona TaxID=994334 RepID=A0A433QHJ6_9FUNG|nr:Sin-like protein conserved region-domain-containing protein [Jimgerdemannia flammicorona]
MIKENNPTAQFMDIDPQDDDAAAVAAAAAEDDDDEVIREIPVFLSQQLAKYLYLLQFPVRNFPFTPGSGPIAARIKPISQLVELDLPLDTRSSMYSEERGKDLAKGTNDKPIRTALDKDDDDSVRVKKKEEEEMLDRQTLSSCLVPNQTNYMVGVIKDNELHLTPVRSTVQLRPSLKYLDKIDEKTKAANKKASDEDNKEERAKKTAEAENKAKAVQISVKSSNPDQLQRKNIYSMAHRMAEEEAWTKLTYYDETVRLQSLTTDLKDLAHHGMHGAILKTYLYHPQTEQANIIFERMFANKKEELRPLTPMEEYVNKISARQA